MMTEWPVIGGDEVQLYANRHSNVKLTPESVRAYTAEQYPNLQHMLMPKTLAMFIGTLAKTTMAMHVWEIGCFTGYLTGYLVCMLDPPYELVVCDTEENHSLKVRNDYWHNRNVRVFHRNGVDLLNDLQPNDIDFAVVDTTEKTDYIDIFDALVDRMAPMGLMLFDNTMFAGTVWHSPNLAQAEHLNRFNSYIVKDTRVEVTMIPAWDGLTIARRLP